MIERFAEDVQERLNKSVRDIEHQLGRGQCATWEEYHHRVGRIVGIETAASIVSQALAVFHEEEDK